jgi:hypothetical protein
LNGSALNENGIDQTKRFAVFAPIPNAECDESNNRGKPVSLKKARIP